MSLETKNLVVRYGKLKVLNGASVTFPAQSVTALVGPNGAGKSTLLRAIAGLQPAEGDVLIEGASADAPARRAEVAYMPQDTAATSSLTLMEVVLLGRLRSLGLSVPGEMLDEAEWSLGRFGLAALAGRTLDAVSGGQRQLVYLAQALFRRPQVLLLDEPTAALDLRHQLIVLETVRETARRDGIVVGVAMHDLSLAAQFADGFLCLANGEVDASGPARDVLSAERLRRLYGVEADIVMSAEGCPRITPIRAV